MAEIDPLAEVKSDHTKVRDILLEFIDSIKKRDVEKSLELLLVLDKLGGPHFRMEEDVMYKILKRFYGEEYYNGLIDEHDRVIRAAKTIGETLGKGALTSEEADNLIKIIQNDILRHPITCSGLEILMEKCTPEELNQIAESIKLTREEDIPLLEWASTIRGKEV